MGTLTRRHVLAAGAAGLALGRRSFGQLSGGNKGLISLSQIRSQYLRPSDYGFISALETNFPGLSTLAAMQRILPFAMVITNPSTLPVRVYGVRWVLTNGGNTSTYKHHFIHGSSPALTPYPRTGQLAMLYPGGIGLATPFFLISNEHYPALRDKWDRWIEKRFNKFEQAERFVADYSAAFSSVSAELVAVVYKTHALGLEAASSAHILQSYRNVEYEQAHLFLKYFSEQGPPGGELTGPILASIMNSPSTANSAYSEALASTAKARFARKVNDLVAANGVQSAVKNLKLITRSRPSKVVVA